MRWEEYECGHTEEIRKATGEHLNAQITLEIERVLRFKVICLDPCPPVFLAVYLLANFVVNALNLERAALIIDEEIDRERLAVGREHQLARDVTLRLPGVDVVFN